MVVDVEDQRRQIERPVAAQRRRIEVYHTRDRLAIAEQIQKMKIEMCEINAGRNGGAALLADPAQCAQQLPGVRPGGQSGMQAITVAARHQGPGDEIRPPTAVGSQPRLPRSDHAPAAAR
jgi:hypothetical protein